MHIENLWIKLNRLLPEPQCTIISDQYPPAEWFDSRPLPTLAEIEAIPEFEWVYHGTACFTKADIDAVTAKRIAAAGEEKAKTLKLLAGAGPCPEWDAFVIRRNEFLHEAEGFLTENGLI